MGYGVWRRGQDVKISSGFGVVESGFVTGQRAPRERRRIAALKALSLAVRLRPNRRRSQRRSGMTDWSNGLRVESDPLLTSLLSTAAGEERERIIEALLLRTTETVSRVLQRLSAHVAKEDLDDIRSTEI